MDDQPVPLLRTNYLSEFRTEIEKAQARKNLGIPDEMQMKWGGMGGHIEEQDDLVYYVKLKAEEYAELYAKYTNAISEEITTVSQALDYIMQFVIGQRQNNIEFQEEFKKVYDTITEAQEALQKSIDANSEDIDAIEAAINVINQQIAGLNQDLIDLDIAPKVVSWINSHISDTINFEDDKLQVIISDSENNALLNQNGLFVKDTTSEINAHNEAIEALQGVQSEILGQVANQGETVASLQKTVDGINMAVAGYNTKLDDALKTPNAVGGIPAGTTVESLKNKTLVQIVDDLLFPTVVRELIYPTLTYTSYIQSVIKVGTTITKPTSIFNAGDSGGKTGETERLTFNGTEIPLDTKVFDQLGTYVYQLTVEYAEGNPLTDNKGQVVPDKYIPAGSLNRSVTHVTTYPWFVNGIEQYSLIRMGSSSGTLTISMGGKARIELPGANSSIPSLKVDGGMGYMPVNWEAWDVTTTTKPEYPGVTYKVWTIKSEYAKDLNHEINFTLAL